MKYIPLTPKISTIFIISTGLYLAAFYFYVFLDLHPIKDASLSSLIKTEIRIPRAIVASLLAIGISGAGCITQTIFQKSLGKPINSWSLIGSHSINSFDKRLHSNKLSTICFIYRSLFSSHVISDVLENFFTIKLRVTTDFGFATNTLISSVNQLIISLDLLKF